MQQYGSKQFAHRPPPPYPGDGVNGQNSIFKQHGHVANQI